MHDQPRSLLCRFNGQCFETLKVLLVLEERRRKLNRRYPVGSDRGAIDCCWVHDSFSTLSTSLSWGRVWPRSNRAEAVATLSRSEVRRPARSVRSGRFGKRTGI